MNLIDTSGWIEYYAGGARVTGLTPLIEGRAATIIVPSIVVYELFKKLLQTRGEEDALQAIGYFRRLTVVPLDEELAVAAAVISHEHQLAMADSIIYATAARYQATLWTFDEHFRGLPRVRYLGKK